MCQICRLSQHHPKPMVSSLLDTRQFSTLIVIDHRQGGESPLPSSEPDPGAPSTRCFQGQESSQD